MGKFSIPKKSGLFKTSVTPGPAAKPFPERPKAVTPSAESIRATPEVTPEVAPEVKAAPTLEQIDSAHKAEVARRAISQTEVKKAAAKLLPTAETPQDHSGFFLQLDDQWLIRGDGWSYTLYEVRTVTGEGRGAAKALAQGTVGQKREVVAGHHGNLRCAAIQYISKAPGVVATQTIAALLAKLDAIDATLNRCFPLRK